MLEMRNPTAALTPTGLRRFSLAVTIEGSGRTFMFAERTSDGRFIAPWPIAVPEPARFLMNCLRAGFIWARTVEQIHTEPDERYEVLWRGVASDPLAALEAAVDAALVRQ